jgi:hypothetical protein
MAQKTLTIKVPFSPLLYRDYSSIYIFCSFLTFFVSDKDVSCLQTFVGILTMLSINIKLD